MDTLPEINIGEPLPLGSSITPTGVNFSIISTSAAFIELLLFEDQDSINPKFIIPLDNNHKTGDYWHTEIKGLKKGCIYGFRVHQLDNNINNDYSKNILIDPCSRGITGWKNYKRKSCIGNKDNINCCLKSVVCDREEFNFKEYPRPNHPWEETIIYELHADAFTKNLCSQDPQSSKSCFKRILSKVPYLKQLGITSIELLPIFCFDPYDAPNGLKNYWGYSPINWFTPHFEYFSECSAIDIRKEFRSFVEACHSSGLEVILDVVYNHTSEGNLMGPVLSWKGFDESLYYHTTKDKTFQDVTGCGNTIAANRGHVRKLIVESLKCWVNEFGVDGFRFDLGAALTRGEDLIPLETPPLFEDIKSDPNLASIKLISEPWDCGGLYKLHDFPSSETFTWNGHFRDDIRKFWKGDNETAWNLGDKIKGSPILYKSKKQSTKSINFISAHDGFTLKDILTFNRKHNFANRESNRDGENNNNSWNHGVEGPTLNKGINNLRKKQQKNLLLTLLISRGVPMILMGDEIGRSQGGNNNTWCQNSPLGWMNWNEEDQDLELLEYLKQLITIRKNFINLLYPKDEIKITEVKSKANFQWHGTKLNEPDWSSWSHTVAFSINDSSNKPLIWCALNAYSKDIVFEIPELESKWIRTIDTSQSEIFTPQIVNDQKIEIENRSSVLLIEEGLLKKRNSS